MESKSALFAVTLAICTATAATAFAVEQQPGDAESGQARADEERKAEVEKQVKKDGSKEEKDYTPTFELEDLFGCKPMGEEGHMPMGEPGSGVGQHETMQHR